MDYLDWQFSIEPYLYFYMGYPMSALASKPHLFEHTSNRWMIDLDICEICGQWDHHLVHELPQAVLIGDG